VYDAASDAAARRDHRLQRGEGFSGRDWQVRKGITSGLLAFAAHGVLALSFGWR
jgi:hypothetical protein